MPTTMQYALTTTLTLTAKLIRIIIQIPVTYPSTAPEIAIPELDGKTAKMYRLESYSILLYLPLE